MAVSGAHLAIAGMSDGDEQFVEVDNAENPRFGRVSLPRPLHCQLHRPGASLTPALARSSRFSLQYSQELGRGSFKAVYAPSPCALPC